MTQEECEIRLAERAAYLFDQMARLRRQQARMLARLARPELSRVDRQNLLWALESIQDSLHTLWASAWWWGILNNPHDQN